MNILGLNYIFHDSSACIVKDGELIAAIEDERLTGDKHTQRFPEKAIAGCLSAGKISVEEIDHIAVSFNPKKHIITKTIYATSLHKAAGSFISYEFLRIRARQKAFWAWYKKVWGESKKRPAVHFIDHHLAHIGGSYFVSPFDDAALLSVDGWGEWSTTWMGHATGHRLEKLSETFFPHSLGCFYSAATEFCGFKPNYDEGKTMGLAPCGNPERFFKSVDGLIKIGESGNIEMDFSLFDFQNVTGRFCSEEFYRVFGEPRRRGEDFEDRHRDVAAAFQAVLEERMLDLCRILETRTKSKNLVLAGGVSLNSVVNGRILRESGFENIYVMPGAGDNGTCIGAAYYLYNSILGEKKRYHHQHPYIGTEYSNSSIESALQLSKVAYRRSDDVCRDTARFLREGKIVAWFQGKMEFGPRSLGGRSILADPTNPQMKDKINAEVKHREAFRPFAPSVSAEDVSRFFDFSGESPFMLMVCDVLSEKQNLLPAITHVDGTARLQTVSRDSSERYHRLIKEFEKLSGVPVVLNTSFNIMDQPIIESPINAIRCFFSTGLDVLVIGDFIVEKSWLRENPAQDASPDELRSRKDENNLSYSMRSAQRTAGAISIQAS
jgi:carbamoyltransferase